MAAIEAGEISQVIASEVSRISRSVRDFCATVEQIVDENGVGLHILDMGIALDPEDSAPIRARVSDVAATFAELEAEIKRKKHALGPGYDEKRAVDSIRDYGFLSDTSPASLVRSESGPGSRS